MPKTKIDLATQTSGNLPITELPKASANSVLVGSGAAGSGNAYTEIALGTNLSMSGSTLNASGTGSGITQLTGDVTAGPGTGSQAATVVATHLTAPLPVAQGGTATATPGLVAGANVTITGTWPNQTVNSTGGSTSPYTVRIKTANYTAVANDVVFCDTSAGGFSVTIPLASANVGAVIIVKKTSLDGNVLGIGRTGSDLIEDNTSQNFLPLQTWHLISDGVSNWWSV